MRTDHRFSPRRWMAVSAGLCAAWTGAQGQMATPIATSNAPLYPATFGSANSPPTALRGADAGHYALNAAVTNIVVEADAAAGVADGQSPIHIVVHLLGKDGKPLSGDAFVTIETNGGRILLPGAHTDEQGPRGRDADKVVPGTQLKVTDGVAEFSLLAPMTPQDVTLRVTAGDQTASGTLSFLPEMREMIAAGLLEGVINLHGRGNAIQPVQRGDAFEQDLLRWSRQFDQGKASLGGRSAFFVKGMISGDVLLTAAYDSDKDTRSALLKSVNPEQMYPVFGDSALQGADARSADRLYVRLDQGKNFLLYGDFQTGDGFSQRSGGGAVASIQQRSLGNYNRTMTGARGHFENGTVTGNAYVTRDTLHQVVEEFASQGSGPYALANNGAVEGSEKVEVVTRDRNNPSRILTVAALVPLVDYTFEPFSGRILLTSFLPAFDSNLNPISLRVSYEVDQGGAPFWVTGADAQVRVGEKAEIGGSFVKEANPLAEYELASANAGVRLSEKTRIVVEIAESRTEANTNAANANTQPGFTNASGSPISGLFTGRAWRVEAVHEDGPLDARVFVGRSDPTFVNPAAPLAGGRGEADAKVSYKLSDTLKLYTEGLRSEDTNVGGGERTAAQAGVTVKVDERLTLDFGVRAIRESVGTLGPVASGAFGSTSGLTGSLATGGAGGAVGGGNQLIDPTTGVPIINTGSTVATSASGAVTTGTQHSDSLRAGIGWKATDRLTVGGEVEHSFAGDDRQRVAAGVDYQIFERTKLYGRFESETGVGSPYALTDPGRKGNAFVFGVDSTYVRDTQAFSEYRLRDAISGPDLELASGVRNTWEIQQGIRLITALEHTTVLSGNVAGSTAATVGLDYSAAALWRASGRIEVRHSGDIANTPGDDSFTTYLAQVTVARKIDRDWTGLARDYVLDTRYAAHGGVLQNRFQLGVAYRDTDTNRVNALGKIEFKDETDASNASVGELVTRATTVSVLADYHPSRPWWMTGRAAIKWQNDQFELGVQDHFRAGLVAGRLIYDVTEHWDVGALAAGEFGQNGARVGAFGVEVGYLLRQNLWLSVGYNASGFRADQDLSGYEYTQRGVYVRLRFKFDEDLFGAKHVDINRALDR